MILLKAAQFVLSAHPCTSSVWSNRGPKPKIQVYVAESAFRKYVLRITPSSVERAPCAICGSILGVNSIRAPVSARTLVLFPPVTPRSTGACLFPIRVCPRRPVAGGAFGGKRALRPIGFPRNAALYPNSLHRLYMGRGGCAGTKSRPSEAAWPLGGTLFKAPCYLYRRLQRLRGIID